MKISTDMERRMFEKEKDRMEGERSEVKMREDQLLNELKSLEYLREKLQQLDERMSEDVKNKIMRLEQNNEDLLKLLSVLGQKHEALDKLKENMSSYTEILQREREGLKSTMSEIVMQRQEMANQHRQEAELEKTHLIELKAEQKQDREDLDRKSEMMNKEKLDLELMRSDILKQSDILEQVIQDIEEGKDKLEITKTELQKQKEHADSQFDKINQEKQQLYQIKTTTESERERFLNENKRMEGELSELKITKVRLTRLMNFMVSLSAKLKELNQRRHEDFRKNMDKFGQKYKDMLQSNSVLEHKCDELDKQKNKVTGYYDLMQKEKKHMVTIMLDKAVQSEVVKEWLQEQDVDEQYFNKPKEFECEKGVFQSDAMIQTEEFEHQWKLEGDIHDLERKPKYLKTKGGGLLLMVAEDEGKNKQKMFKLAPEPDDFTDEKMSRRDCLRKIWKDTKMERKEINQMKCMSHEMKNNIEKRLKVINQFVKRTWLQKEKELLENKLKQGLSKDMTSQIDCERDSITLDKKYREIQQLQVQMLSEKEKLCTLTSIDKANQTFKVDITTRDGTMHVKQQTSAKMYQEKMKVEETDAAPETSSGLLCQLRHFCYRCCCPCCPCCKQV
ncbi:chromosome partition protein Smc-like [Perca fluviatilis]|uniref:chromosome partition protein Smc-like n=1 Tax=Perca fluviatilis TaxID=8168 RepID=UPI001963B676|nr:chromosome partition protein Smc-like [Perca fluviatilis]